MLSIRPFQEVPLPVKVSWVRRHIVSRFSWALAIFAFLAAIPLLIINQIPNLLTLHLWTAFRSILFGTLACLALTIFSIINVFVPSLGERVARDLVFPAKAKAHAEWPSSYTDDTDDPNQVYVGTGKLDTIEIADFTLSKDLKHTTTRPSVIFFCGNGYPFQGRETGRKLFNYQKAWEHDIRVFNYPAVTEGAPEDNAMVRAINAGIAQVYDIVTQKELSFENDAAEIRKHCKLYGHSTGGAIALQVAHYFKQKHHIDLKVIADRSLKSFSAAIAGQLNWLTGIPFWFGNLLGRLFLYAGGNLDVDSMSAYRGINPSSVDYFNVARPELPFFSNYTDHWLTAPAADLVIHDDATLTTAIQENGRCPLTTGAKTLRTLRENHSPHVLVETTMSNTDYYYHGASLERQCIYSYWHKPAGASVENDQKTTNEVTITGLDRVKYSLNS